MRIRAALLEAPGRPFSIEELDLADPKQGEVLVRVKAAGICHSDWHVATGDTKHPLPVVCGHEGAGVVEAVGEGVTGVKPGDHVSLNWAPSCGECFYCGIGRPALCGTYVGPIWAGTMLDGTTRLSRNGAPVYHYSALACFADYCVVPEVCCVAMPREVPFEIAAVIGCAVATGVGAALNTAKIAKGSSVAVFGTGGVGLSAVMGAKLAGAESVIAVDPSAERRKAALDLGATHAIPPEESTRKIRDLTEGRGADCVIECVGATSVQEKCLEAARFGGTVVFAGLAPMGSSTNIPGAVLVRQEKTVMGSYYGTSHPAEDFPKYGRWYLQGLLPLDRLVAKTYRLEQVNEAFEHMLAGRGARGVIVSD